MSEGEGEKRDRMQTEGQRGTRIRERGRERTDSVRERSERARWGRTRE